MNFFDALMRLLRGSIMLILPPFFFSVCGEPLLLSYLLFVFLFATKILIFNQCFPASSLYYFDLAFFFATTSSLLNADFT